MCFYFQCEDVNFAMKFQWRFSDLVVHVALSYMFVLIVFFLNFFDFSRRRSSLNVLF
jgi:hypothetical protein